MEGEIVKKRMNPDFKFLLIVFLIVVIVSLLLYLIGFFDSVNKELCMKKCETVGSYSEFEVGRPNILICKCLVNGDVAEFEKTFGNSIWRDHSEG